jgi:hypothetical protein
MIVLQEWEGCVTDIDRNKGEFYADLIDITANETMPGEIADIPLKYAPENIVEGMIFWWRITVDGDDVGSSFTFMQETWDDVDFQQTEIMMDLIWE